MIGRLKGVVVEVGTETCVIDVGGVGYVAWCPASSLSALVPGTETVLQVETVVREDMIRLYGFRSAADREWFRLLSAKVRGAGPKAAMGLLSELGAEGLVAAVSSGDVKALSRAPGVGPKLAERIVGELKVSADMVPMDAHGPASEAVEALVALGHARPVASAAVARAVLDSPGADAGTLVKRGLLAAATGR